MLTKILISYVRFLWRSVPFLQPFRCALKVNGNNPWHPSGLFFQSLMEHRRKWHNPNQEYDCQMYQFVQLNITVQS